ncbi:hypothetical protein CLOSTHATH_02892 [Hungatella hathewayi DSM 13479]|uniref:Uncharacterized protein n=1 Tax=Hungatella hathewayi DSM 13479 TaxID=566550 RepID=D3AH05_9FIRM|nr:hypothetical protein CLOSTHATH_02892 [Hungatella hathewayi DSM 13479]
MIIIDCFQYLILFLSSLALIFQHFVSYSHIFCYFSMYFQLFV